MHLLSSLQAVAHGSDTVQYFQWRKGRGGSEKFHGAVVDHVGHERTRVFQDVQEVGALLKCLDPVVGTTVEPEVALIFDWENRWALEDAQAIREEKKYEETCYRHYYPFWSRGVPVDVINEDADFSRYRLLIAPMLYMIRPGVAERISQFVADGGTFVATYWSGIVDENDRCFLGGFPGPLRKVLGIWAEEIDALYDGEVNYVAMNAENNLGLNGVYKAQELCEIIHLETGEALGVYKKDFYAGCPAVTVNRYGKGEAYYLASNNEDRFLEGFYEGLTKKIQIKRVLPVKLPTGVTAQLRTDGVRNFIFILNFTAERQIVDLPDEAGVNLLTKEEVQGRTELPPYGWLILQRGRREK
jgi:beta-galactosidase